MKANLVKAVYLPTENIPYSYKFEVEGCNEQITEGNFDFGEAARGLADIIRYSLTSCGISVGSFADFKLHKPNNSNFSLEFEDGSWTFSFKSYTPLSQNSIELLGDAEIDILEKGERVNLLKADLENIVWYSGSLSLKGRFEWHGTKKMDFFARYANYKLNSYYNILLASALATAEVYLWDDATIETFINFWSEHSEAYIRDNSSSVNTKAEGGKKIDITFENVVNAIKTTFEGNNLMEDCDVEEYIRSCGKWYMSEEVEEETEPMPDKENAGYDTDKFEEIEVTGVPFGGDPFDAPINPEDYVPPEPFPPLSKEGLEDLELPEE